MILTLSKKLFKLPDRSIESLIYDRYLLDKDKEIYRDASNKLISTYIKLGAKPLKIVWTEIPGRINYNNITRELKCDPYSTELLALKLGHIMMESGDKGLILKLINASKKVHDLINSGWIRTLVTLSSTVVGISRKNTLLGLIGSVAIPLSSATSDFVDNSAAASVALSLLEKSKVPSKIYKDSADLYLTMIASNTDKGLKVAASQATTSKLLSTLVLNTILKNK